MDMDLVFLGTGGSAPTARRSTACLLARVGGDRLLFDCGEGSQRQMQRSTGLVQVDSIFITHLHADHYLGIPGLLKTYDLNDRDRPLRIFGPPGLIELFSALRRVFGRIGYEVEVVELDAGEGGAPRQLRGPPVRGRPSHARLRLRARRGRASRALRPRRGPAPGRLARARLQAPAEGRERRRHGVGHA